MPKLIDNVGSCVILKVANVFNVSVGKPTMLYYSIFQQLFKFIPDNGDSSGERDPYPAYKEAEPRFPFDVSPG